LSSGEARQEALYYVKATPLRSLEELEQLKRELLTKKVIMILKVTPLAEKSMSDLLKVVEDLYQFVVSMGGDIARLGDERIIITPPGIRIWRNF
jgi:SepF-like predicted cell division protein (DUF552 family)